MDLRPGKQLARFLHDLVERAADVGELDLPDATGDHVGLDPRAGSQRHGLIVGRGCAHRIRLAEVGPEVEERARRAPDVALHDERVGRLTARCLPPLVALTQLDQTECSDRPGRHRHLQRLRHGEHAVDQRTRCLVASIHGRHHGITREELHQRGRLRPTEPFANVVHDQPILDPLRRAARACFPDRSPRPPPARDPRRRGLRATRTPASPRPPGSDRAMRVRVRGPR